MAQERRGERAKRDDETEHLQARANPRHASGEIQRLWQATQNTEQKEILEIIKCGGGNGHGAHGVSH
jgi:hypothetical protein